MSKEELWSALSKSESVESEKNLDNVQITKIREEFNKLKDWFLKPKIKEIRRNLYEMKTKRIF